MPKPRIQSSTKGATITKQGHTTDTLHGSNPRATSKFGRKTRNIDPEG